MRRLLLFFACCPAAFAEPGLNVLTVTASRVLNIQPDQASLMVSVATSVNTGLDDVLSALQAANITVASFAGVGGASGSSVSSTSTTGTTSAVGWLWSFTPMVPLSSLKATLASLATLQQALSQTANPMDLEYYVQGASISAQLLAANACPYTAVFSDAQTQAQKVAAAAGITLGPVVGLTDGYGTAIQPSFAETGVYQISAGALTAFASPVASAPPCSMVVQFKLGQ